MNPFSFLSVQLFNLQISLCLTRLIQIEWPQMTGLKAIISLDIKKRVLVWVSWNHWFTHHLKFLSMEVHSQWSQLKGPLTNFFRAFTIWCSDYHTFEDFHWHCWILKPKTTASLNRSRKRMPVSKSKTFNQRLSDFPPWSLKLKPIVLFSGHSQPYCLDVVKRAASGHCDFIHGGWGLLWWCFAATCCSY